MNEQFKSNSLVIALTLACSGFTQPVLAVGPYPPLPPAITASVTPNIMLYIDNSLAMLEGTDILKPNLLTGVCSNTVAECAVNNTNGWLGLIDIHELSKINIAKASAKTLVNANPTLRFGLFAFDDPAPAHIINAAVGFESGSILAEIKNMTDPVNTSNPLVNRDNLITAIDGLRGRTGSPLGEGLLEITQYFGNKPSLYNKSLGIYSGAYKSPIQYRCQKNYNIIISNADPTGDNNLPALSYQARDSAGNAVSKIFSTCSAADNVADDGMTVNCPAGTIGPGWPLRDAAKYARVADLRVGGSDQDTPPRSFDDPKFALQNLTTYTVGFLPTNPVLPAVSVAGGGTHFQANDTASLTTALNQIISGITISAPNGGGVATFADITGGISNWLFQPVFYPTGWSGELRCLQSDVTTGTVANCSPNAKATIPLHPNRIIYSAKVVAGASPSTTAFLFNSTNVGQMTSAQRTSLGVTASTKTKPAFTDPIDYLRGKSFTTYRVRPTDANGNILLGDIIDAQPIVVGAPTGTPALTDAGAVYAKFQSDNAKRGLIFIGANDGMLHAFNIADPVTGHSDMGEIMAYVPSAVYPRLAAFMDLNYGTPAIPHTYHVNGTAQSLDVNFGGTWNTLLVGGLGQGGQGYYAIDATSKESLTSINSSPIKWEWTNVNDSNMGYSFGKPIIYNVRKIDPDDDTVVSQPAVILSNGYNNNFDNYGADKGTKVSPAITTSALYILNADNGTLIKKIVLDTASSNTGLSSPVGVDYGQDGVIDYVYAGDMGGKLWRFNLTAADPEKFTYFPTPIFDAGPTHPISNRPAVIAVNDKNGASRGNLILFGTGKLLTEKDRTDPTVQSFYAVLDNMTDGQTTLTRGSLIMQEVTDTVITGLASGYRAGTYRKVSTYEYASGNPSNDPIFDLTIPTDPNDNINPDPAKNRKNGWYMDFPVSTERLVTPPILVGDKLIFGTGFPVTEEKCLSGGRGWVMGLNPFTGSVVRSKGKDYSFVDIFLDGKSTVEDKVTFGKGAGTPAYVSGYQINVIPNLLTYTSNSQTIVDPSTSGIGMRNVNYMSVYMANAAPGTSRGDLVGVPTDGGTGGTLTTSGIGNDSTERTKINAAPSSGIRYKVLATTWRELKQ
ncbi:MAG: PilC/PilY family type IV pilus protein [Betaproteobacteria bacterium]